MELKNINIQKDDIPYDLSALAEGMLLREKDLPAHMPEDLQTLRKMLEDAVKGEEGTDTPAPVPPGYGKTATPCAENCSSRCMLLRQDIAEPFQQNLTILSSRKNGEYVMVPQVVGQGGNT